MTPTAVLRACLLALCALTAIGHADPGHATEGDAAAVPASVDSEQGLYRVRIVDRPHPIPEHSYFRLRVAVMDAEAPSEPLNDVSLTVQAGMRHGLKHGFAHGMQSQPKVVRKGNEFLVEGLFFHMTGLWTLKVSIDGPRGADQAWLDLPCCGS